MTNTYTNKESNIKSENLIDLCKIDEDVIEVIVVTGDTAIMSVSDSAEDDGPPVLRPYYEDERSPSKLDVGPASRQRSPKKSTQHF